MWTSKEDELRLIQPVEYHAPSGLFDDAAASKPPPRPLLEMEESSDRMDVFRRVLAGLVLQHVFLCICAIVGVQLHLMQIKLPEHINPINFAMVVVVYAFMWTHATRWPSNLYLFMLFTLLMGAYMTVSVAGKGEHILANLVFQFSLGWVLMLLYSLPSFCCDLSIFDIKFSGYLGYLSCLIIACVVGFFAALKISGGSPSDTALPVAFGAVYQLGSLICFRQALGFFLQRLPAGHHDLSLDLHP